MKKILLIIPLIITISCSQDDELIEKPKVEVSKIASDNSLVQKAPFYPSNNGDFVKTYYNPPGSSINLTMYYVKFQGVWRHIDSQVTWDGLFADHTFRYEFPSIETMVDVTQTSVGGPIYADNGLLQNPTTGEIFFREGNTLRWIPSMAIFNQYKFNPAAVIQTTNTGANYIHYPDLW
ncbi:hypothetical protein J3D55_001526 [Chryseobacterium ginsenosidimutans]|uniref:hypothetical protein n=1 Tax=Chryseobacterium ginsenosidimutans TaxID=687846 RepID=UPI0021686048|nr:hypothetical protein [Chryseobacterium ginsenosidimutans]MCS3868610.1 hypothetical protein [Chryseobacterium ginsenosidimutans]